MTGFGVHLSQMKRKIELGLIIVYFFPGISVGLVVRNFIFFDISNIWVSLIFLFPLILVLISVVLYKKNRSVSVPLVLSAIYWIGLAGPKLFDDVVRSKASLAFFVLMTVVSFFYPLFLTYLKIKKIIRIAS